MANKAQQDKAFEEKLRQVEMEQQINNKPPMINSGKQANSVPRPAIIVEEMKEEANLEYKSLRAQVESSVNIAGNKSGMGGTLGIQGFFQPARNNSNQVSAFLDRPQPAREISAKNVIQGFGVDDFDIKPENKNFELAKNVNKSFMRKQTVKEPTVY